MTTEAQAVAESSAPVVLADPTSEDQNTPAVTATDGEVDKQQAEPVKTFTQAEVDALVQKRLLKEERRVHRRIEQQLREAQQQQTAQVEPKREAYQDDDAFVQAQIEHLAEKRAAEKLAQRQQADEAERRNESFLEKAEKASERYPDFHTVVGNPTLQINDGMAEFLAESELGADVAYFLGKNPIKAAHIAQLSPIKAARELTRIEAEIAAQPKATPSQAPAPITPVGTRGKASTSALPSDDDDIDTWMRKEAARTRSR